MLPSGHEQDEEVLGSPASQVAAFHSASLSGILASVSLDSAFARLKTAFPVIAQFQGTHFVFAERDGVWLIERKKHDRYFYWLLWEGKAKLVHAAMNSKLAPLRTIGDSFSVSAAYN